MIYKLSLITYSFISEPADIQSDQFQTIVEDVYNFIDSLHNKTMLEQVKISMQTQFEDILKELDYQSGKSIEVDWLLDTIDATTENLTLMVQYKLDSDLCK